VARRPPEELREPVDLELLERPVDRDPVDREPLLERELLLEREPLAREPLDRALLDRALLDREPPDRELPERELLEPVPVRERDELLVREELDELPDRRVPLVERRVRRRVGVARWSRGI